MPLLARLPRSSWLPLMYLASVRRWVAPVLPEYGTFAVRTSPQPALISLEKGAAFFSGMWTMNFIPSKAPPLFSLHLLAAEASFHSRLVLSSMKPLSALPHSYLASRSHRPQHLLRPRHPRRQHVAHTLVVAAAVQQGAAPQLGQRPAQHLRPLGPARHEE